MRSKLYNKRVEICITEKQKMKLSLIAKEKELTINQLIRILIERINYGDLK